MRPLPTNGDAALPAPLTTLQVLTTCHYAGTLLQLKAGSFTQGVGQQARRSRIPMSGAAGCGVTLYLSSTAKRIYAPEHEVLGNPQHAPACVIYRAVRPVIHSGEAT